MNRTRHVLIALVARPAFVALAGPGLPLAERVALVVHAAITVPPVEAELVAATAVAFFGGYRPRAAGAGDRHGVPRLARMHSPGDSGEAPKITWTLPAGVTVSPIAWSGAAADGSQPPSPPTSTTDEVLLPVRDSTRLSRTSPRRRHRGGRRRRPGSVCRGVPTRRRRIRLELPGARTGLLAGRLAHAPFAFVDQPPPSRPRPLPGRRASCSRLDHATSFVADGRARTPQVEGGETPASMPSSATTVTSCRVEEQPWVDAPAGRTLVLPQSRTLGVPAPTRVKGLLVGTHPTQGPFAFEVDTPVAGTTDLGGAVVLRTVSPPTASHAAAAPPSTTGPTAGSRTSGPGGLLSSTRSASPSADPSASPSSTPSPSPGPPPTPQARRPATRRRRRSPTRCSSRSSAASCST